MRYFFIGILRDISCVKQNLGDKNYSFIANGHQNFYYNTVPNDIEPGIHKTVSIHVYLTSPIRRRKYWRMICHYLLYTCSGRSYTEAESQFTNCLVAAVLHARKTKVEISWTLILSPLRLSQLRHPLNAFRSSWFLRIFFGESVPLLPHIYLTELRLGAWVPKHCLAMLWLITRDRRLLFRTRVLSAHETSEACRKSRR